MWNGSRRDILKGDVYRAHKVIEVFKSIGFEIGGQTQRVAFMQFHDKEVNVEPFMIQCEDVAIIAYSLEDILRTIKFPIPFFEQLYAKIN